MRRLLFYVLAFVGLGLSLYSCQKAPVLEFTGPTTVSFTRDGGSQRITFTTNRDWSVSSSQSWCKPSPATGSASDTPITVTLSCDANSTYDDRSATITIKADELTQTIQVSQATGLGLLVSPETVELSNAAQTFEIEVQKNVPYTVSVDDACKEWLQYTGTKGLTSEKATFSVAANESYDNREGKITFKQTDGSLTATVVVKQKQTDGLFVTTPEYNLSDEGHTLSVEVMANVSFDVTPEADWIHYVETKALKSSTITLTVDANDTYDDRTGTVQVKQKNGSLAGTITIAQKQKDYLAVTPKSFDVTCEAQTIALEVQDNVSYSVVIPDEAKGWITLLTDAETKAVTTDDVVFAIAENASYDNREASITIKQVDGPLAETVIVHQRQTDALFITTPEYNLSDDSHTLSVEVQANVSFEVTPQVSWIHYVETKALHSSTITLTVDANDTYDARTGKVTVKQTNGSLEGEITVNQAVNYGLFVSPEVISITKDAQVVQVEVKYNTDYDCIIPDAAKDWISIQTEPETKGLVTDKVSFAIAENKAYLGREAAIAFKQKGGDLTGTVKIVQAQTDYLGISPMKDSLSYKGGTISFSVVTNIDYTLTPAPEADWITVGEGEESGTSAGLTTFKYTVTAPENEVTAARYATVAVNSNSGEFQKTYTLAQGPQPVVEFDDANFKAYCIENYDLDGDGELTATEAGLVTRLDLYNKDIASLKGMEYMSNLETLDFGKNQVSSLDTSHNPALVKIGCYNNILTSIDVSGSPALTELTFGNNQVTSIDLSHNPALTKLEFYNNAVTELDLSHNPALVGLSCGKNRLTVLDVSYCKELSILSCSENPSLTEIWLAEGQTIEQFTYDTGVATLKYK